MKLASPGEIIRSLGRAPSAALIGAVRLYQWSISPWLGPTCRFYPSCSNYMIGAVRKYGFWKGACRGVWRICRCNPLNRGGLDPP